MKLFDSGTWQADLTQLLDEHHLAVLSDDAAQRARFNASFCDHLRGLSDTQVIGINGKSAADLPGFAAELARRLRTFEGYTVEPTLPGVIESLRTWPGGVHHRYFVWRDADVMLEADIALFSRLVNALCAVAAEREHLDPSPLVIQRAIFLGGPKLGAYTEDEQGQFRRWLFEQDENGEDVFWEVFSCVERPSVLTYRLDG